MEEVSILFALSYIIRPDYKGERFLRGLPNSRPNREEVEFAQAGRAVFTTLCSEYRKRLAINMGKTPFLRGEIFPSE